MSLYEDLTDVLTPYADKINELNGSINALSHTSKPVGSWIRYHYINVTPSTVNTDAPTLLYNWECMVIPVLPGETYSLRVAGNSTSARPWTILKEDKTVISRGIDISDGEKIVIPTNGAYLVLNNNYGNNKYRYVHKIIENPSDISERITNLENLISLFSPLFVNHLEKLAWVYSGSKDFYNAFNLLQKNVYPKLVIEYNPGDNVIYSYDDVEVIRQYLTVTYYADWYDEGTVLNSDDYVLVGTLDNTLNPIEVNYNGISQVVIIEVADLYSIEELSYSSEDADSGNYTFLNKYQLSYTDSGMYIAASNARATLVCNLGVDALSINRSSYSVSEYRLIPIPKWAATLTITYESESAAFDCYIHLIVQDSTKTLKYVSRANSGGWLTMRKTGITYTIPKDTKERQSWLGLNIKTSNGGTFPIASSYSINLRFNREE